MKTPNLTGRRGNTLVLAMVTLAVLAVMGAVSLMAIQRKYHLAYQTSSWQEALSAAEAGVDVAVAEARRSLFDSTAQFGTGPGWTAFPGEAFTDSNGNGRWDAGEAYTDANHNGKYDSKHWEYHGTLAAAQGSNAESAAFDIVVDTPPSTLAADAEPYYRVRVYGMTEVAGPQTPGGIDKNLRMIFFQKDRFTNAVLSADQSKPVGERPHATRCIEAILKPKGAFPYALFATDHIEMTDHNIVVDSYDSRDPNKSTNGKYDPAKHTKNGDVVTDGVIIDAGDAHIYGDVATHNGLVRNGDNVDGTISSDFWQDVFPVQEPHAGFATTPTTITSAMDIQASPNTPTQIKVDTITLGGKETLHIVGDPTGAPTYCQIVVKNNIVLTGNSQIQIDNGVYVRIFIEGADGSATNIAGNGVANPNDPLHLQLYGVDRTVKNPDGSIKLNPDGSHVVSSYGDIKIAGNGGFNGAVYAPDYDVTLVGGGNSDNIAGSFTGHVIRVTGIQKVHYDEALEDGGLIADYKVISWFEDIIH